MISSVVEHFLGKEEVVSSSLIDSSKGDCGNAVAFFVCGARAAARGGGLLAYSGLWAGQPAATPGEGLLCRPSLPSAPRWLRSAPLFSLLTFYLLLNYLSVGFRLAEPAGRSHRRRRPDHYSLQRQLRSPQPPRAEGCSSRPKARRPLRWLRPKKESGS